MPADPQHDHTFSGGAFPEDLEANFSDTKIFHDEEDSKCFNYIHLQNIHLMNFNRYDFFCDSIFFSIFFNLQLCAIKRTIPEILR